MEREEKEDENRTEKRRDGRRKEEDETPVQIKERVSGGFVYYDVLLEAPRGSYNWPDSVSFLRIYV